MYPVMCLLIFVPVLPERYSYTEWLRGVICSGRMEKITGFA